MFTPNVAISTCPNNHWEEGNIRKMLFFSRTHTVSTTTQSVGAGAASQLSVCCWGMVGRKSRKICGKLRKHLCTIILLVSIKNRNTISKGIVWVHSGPWWVCSGLSCNYIKSWNYPRLTLNYAKSSVRISAWKETVSRRLQSKTKCRSSPMLTSQLQTLRLSVDSPFTPWLSLFPF